MISVGKSILAALLTVVLPAAALAQASELPSVADILDQARRAAEAEPAPSTRVRPDDPALLPPAVLYHFGRKSYLLQDALWGTIPEDVWKNAIMGEGNYGLLPFRRGLYGASHPSFAENWGDYALNSGQEPWFIAIHVKPGCRRPENAAVISGLPWDGRFQKWFSAAKPAAYPALKDFVSACYADRVGLTIAFVSNLGSSPSDCEPVLQDFLTAADIKVVFDEALPDADSPEDSFAAPMSWYIRDRACIESIEGTPEQVLGVAASLPSLWRAKPERGLDRGSSGETEFVILVDALRDAAAVDAGTLAGLRAVAAASDLTDGRQRFWVQEGVAAVLDAYQRCALSHAEPIFKDAAGRFLAESASSRRRPALEAFIASAGRLCRD